MKFTHGHEGKFFPQKYYPLWSIVCSHGRLQSTEWTNLVHSSQSFTLFIFHKIDFNRTLRFHAYVVVDHWYKPLFLFTWLGHKLIEIILVIQTRSLLVAVWWHSRGLSLHSANGVTALRSLARRHVVEWQETIIFREFRRQFHKRKKSSY